MLAKAYARNEEMLQKDETTIQFRLQQNLVYVLMFGDRAPEVKDSVLQVKRVLEGILKNIQPK